MSIATSSASALTDAAFWPLLLGAAGALAGSFLATLAIRWQRDESVVRGRSACDACGAPLGIAALIPVLSFVAQRGRCRACGGAIDPRHLVVELGGIAVGALAGAVAGPAGIAGVVFGWLLLTLAVLDAAELWLPDPLVATLAIAGVASAWWLPPAPLDRLIGGAAGFGSLWAIAAGYRAWRGVEGMGAGDAKLLGAIGLWLGWRLLPAVLLIAALVGLGVVLIRRVGGAAIGRDEAVPFGAWLAVAAYPAWLAMIASGT